MRRFESGEALAKEMGIKPEILKATCEFFMFNKSCSFFSLHPHAVDKYNDGVRKKNDPFGKKVYIYLYSSCWLFHYLTAVIVVLPIW